MRVIRNINNNVCVCLDSKNNEIVAFGRGIGFVKPPHDVPLSRIDRTFYNVTMQQIDLIGSIPEEVMSVATEIVDHANRLLGNQFRSNVTFTLADHINFTLERWRKGIMVRLPFYYETEQLYPEEVAVGKEALAIIHRHFDIRLPREEASAIALHLVNYESDEASREEMDKGEIIEECTDIIEREAGVSVDREGYAYYRFVMHMHRLLRGCEISVDDATKSNAIYEALRKEYPEAHHYAQIVARYLGRLFDRELGNEELLYLTLHINLLCTRETLDEGDSDASITTVNGEGRAG